jgi:hypothetical protein
MGDRSRNLLGCEFFREDVKIKRPRPMAGPFIDVLVSRQGLFYPLISLGSIMWW